LRSPDGRLEVVGAQNVSGERIAKNIATLQDLMSSAVKGGAQCGLAWLSLLHGETNFARDAKSGQ
jgi:hypothetical protein